MKKYLTIFTLVSIWAGASGITYGGPAAPESDHPVSEPQSYHYGHYGDVRALCRVGDSLWVGTGGGLFIFDLGRNEFTSRLLVGDRLPSSSVRAIESRGDSVLVGTDLGLSIFGGESVQVLTTKRPGPFVNTPFDAIRSIDFGLDREIYLSTNGHGLSVLDVDTSWVITREDSLLDDKVYGMVQEDDTTFYFATSMGLCAYRDSAWVGFQAGAQIPRAEVRKILPAPDHGYYLLVGGRGVFLFDGFRARSISSDDLVPENAISDMVMDQRGNLWVCGGLGGVAVYQNEHWTRINAGDPTVDRLRWRCAYADGDGVFFGSADGLIISIRDNVLTRIRMPDELRTGSVGTIIPDSTQAVYLLNGAYLLRMAPGGGIPELDYPTPDVVAMTVSPQGVIWVVTRWSIYYRGASGYLEFDPEFPKSTPLYSALGFDPGGNLWVGTQDGEVYRYDGEIWMRMGDQDELGAGSIRSLDFDAIGRLWVISYGGGIAMFNGGRWNRFENSVFGGRPVQDLTISPNGVPVLATDVTIWGYDITGGWKLVEFKKTPAEGEPDHQETYTWSEDAGIAAIGFDAAGRLFVGTENGLAVVDAAGRRWVGDAAMLGGIAVAGIHVDDRDLWIGFRRDGLTRLNLNSTW